MDKLDQLDFFIGDVFGAENEYEMLNKKSKVSYFGFHSFRHLKKSNNGARKKTCQK
jgi:hypothetical protein